MTLPGEPLLLLMEGIEKSFPGVCALRDGRLQLRRGECHALMGENGAGKSTLIKILAGAQLADAGEIWIDGRRHVLKSPLDARRAGIAVIYQELNLVPTLTVRENLFLGREKTTAGWLRPREERRAAAVLFDRLGVRIDPDIQCGALSVAQRQLVEIARAISLEAKIVVMDEPTAALTSGEAERLFAVIGDLRRRGCGVVYVSHRIDEVFRISDRITVMRDGAHIETRPTRDLSRQRLIELMVGRTLENEFPKEHTPPGEEVLRLEGLRRAPAVNGVSFNLRRGEVLGMTGLIGAGRTEVARLLFGADRRDSGKMFLKGREKSINSPRDAINSGISLLTEDRKSQGLVLGLGVRENFGLPNLKRFSRLGFVRRSRENRAFDFYVSSLRIRIPHRDEPAINLSGGNQQKVVLAKWLQANADVIIFDEPTRGIDVGAKFEIYQLINRLAAAGKGILLISSEMPEVLGMSDRILVMHAGRIVGRIDDPAQATQEQILTLAMGEAAGHSFPRSAHV